MKKIITRVTDVGEAVIQIDPQKCRVPFWKLEQIEMPMIHSYAGNNNMFPIFLLYMRPELRARFSENMKKHGITPRCLWRAVENAGLGNILLSAAWDYTDEEAVRVAFMKAIQNIFARDIELSFLSVVQASKLVLHSVGGQYVIQQMSVARMLEDRAIEEAMISANIKEYDDVWVWLEVIERLVREKIDKILYGLAEEAIMKYYRDILKLIKNLENKQN